MSDDWRPPCMPAAVQKRKDAAMTDAMEQRIIRAQETAVEARDTANRALILIERHTDECNRREDDRQRREQREHDESVAHRREVKEALGQLTEQISELGKGQQTNREGVYKVLVAGLLIICGGALSLLAYILVNGAPWWLPGVGPQ